MKKIQILSVGGSADPVVNAVKKSKADHYYFFCSSGPKGSEPLIDGPGDPCGDKRKTTCPDCKKDHYIGNPTGPAIVYQTNLTQNQYSVIKVDDPDNLDECYTALKSKAEEITQVFGADCAVTANYTGGTKTMSVSLALLAVLEEKWGLMINKGPRNDLVKVRVGDSPVAVDKWRLHCENQFNMARQAIRRFDYAQAEDILSGTLVRPLEKSLSVAVQDAINTCRAFDAWDKFNQQKALDLLLSCKRKSPEYIMALKQILGQTKQVSQYERVGDLLNNAERRAQREHYDDAVGRLYRATELFAQTRFKTQYGWDSANLHIKDLPAEIRSKYESRARDNKKLLLGLHDDYELLVDLADPVSSVYEKYKGKLLDTLKKRNDSIFAHGITPLGQSDYSRVKDILSAYIADCAQAIGIEYTLPQFPQEGVI